MTAIIMNVTPEGLSEPLEELLLAELYESESDLEDAIIPRIDACAPLIVNDDLMVIGRQVSLKMSDGPGRGLTLDILAISRSAQLWVIELKISLDKLAVSQAAAYSALVHHVLDADRVVELFQAYLENTRGGEVGPGEAFNLLIEFCGQGPVTLESELELSDEAPGIVVISPTVTAEDICIAKFHSGLGLDVVYLQPHVHNHDGSLQLVVHRVYPEIDPQSEGRLRNVRRSRVGSTGAQIDPAGAVGRRGRPAKPLQEKVEDAMVRTLECLMECDAAGTSITISDLRHKVASREFTVAFEHLREQDLIETETVANGRRGANPQYVSVTEDGRKASRGELEAAPGQIGYERFSEALLGTPEEIAALVENGALTGGV